MASRAPRDAPDTDMHSWFKLQRQPRTSQLPKIPLLSDAPPAAARKVERSGGSEAGGGLRSGAESSAAGGEIGSGPNSVANKIAKSCCRYGLFRRGKPICPGASE
jgi:hypothetical protein